jgi:branched-subunit amino acid aminotransferase/4-amino-4-deoxychorismate lyase
MMVEERPVRVEEVWNAEEAFMTGTTKKVLPVVRIGDRIIGNGTPGIHTRKLMALFAEFEDAAVNR